MEVPIAEVFDGYTIVKLKVERLPEGKDLRGQLKLYENELREKTKNLGKKKKRKVKKFLDDLFKTNRAIWDLEHDLRNGYENKMSLAEIGKRAITVRNLNGMRMKIKNEIYDFFDQPTFKEVKIDHIAEKLFVDN